MTDWITGLIEQGGYVAIALLMFLETVFPPIPSEVIMSLAGFAAAQGKISLAPTIMSGAAGAMVGNAVWFWAARALGMERLKPLILRHGRWLTMGWSDVARAERWFARNGHGFVCIGRMMPTIRSLVSVPAGLMRMATLPFLLWSSLGTLGWTTMLALVGWVLGRRFAEVEVWLNHLSTALIAAMLLWYLWRVIRWQPHIGSR